MSATCAEDLVGKRVIMTDRTGPGYLSPLAHLMGREYALSLIGAHGEVLGCTGNGMVHVKWDDPHVGGAQVPWRWQRFDLEDEVGWEIVE